MCPVHNRSTFREGGTSEAGKPYGAYWACMKSCQAGEGGASWSMWDEDWQTEVQLARGETKEPAETMEVPYDE